MAKRSRTFTLGQAVDTAKEKSGLAHGLARQRVLDEWAQVAGPALAAHTLEVRFVQHNLHVRVDSPGWQQQLNMQRGLLLDRVNAYAGREVAKDLRVEV